MQKTLGLLLFIVLLAAGCSPGAGQPADAPVAESPVDAAAMGAETPAESSPPGVAAPPGYDGRTWADIVAEANGQSVDFYMWGGSDLINTWVTRLSPRPWPRSMAITLNMVPISDATEYVNKVLGEKQAGATRAARWIWCGSTARTSARCARAICSTASWSSFCPVPRTSIGMTPAWPTTSASRSRAMSRPTARPSSS